MNKLKELKAKFGELQTKREELKAKRDGGTGLTEAEAKEYADFVDQQSALLDEIKALEREIAVDAAAAGGQNVPGDVMVMGPAAEGAKYSLGEYLLDIASGRLDRSPRFSNKQQQFKAAASGLNEALPSDGGFLVGTDMAAELIRRTYSNGELAKRCSRAPVSAGSNGLTINGIDETSRANGSRHGGIQGYWEGEADDITASKPKFYPISLKLKKLTVGYYATDELLADAPALTAIVNEAVGDEFAFKLDDAIISGTGAGIPQGFLNAPCKIAVAKASGQAKDTIIWENIRDMYPRVWGRKNAIWLTNDECLPQLIDMVKPVGTSGVAVWLPSNAAINQPYDTLLGRPIFYVEQASALGDVGDINLVDLSAIQLIEKGGIQGASSIHVRFLQNEQVFRFTYRVDAQAKWKSALTPYKGTMTKSPFVTLAARA